MNAVEKCDLFVKNIDCVKSASNKTSITAMSWGDGFEEEVILGYSNQLVKIYNLKNKSFTLSEEKKTGEGSIIGINKKNGWVYVLKIKML